MIQSFEGAGSVSLRHRQLVVRQMDTQVLLEVVRSGGDVSKPLTAKVTIKDGSGMYHTDHLGLSQDEKKPSGGAGGEEPFGCTLDGTHTHIGGTCHRLHQLQLPLHAPCMLSLIHI